MMLNIKKGPIPMRKKRAMGMDAEDKADGGVDEATENKKKKSK